MPYWYQLATTNIKTPQTAYAETVPPKNSSLTLQTPHSDKAVHFSIPLCVCPQIRQPWVRNQLRAGVTCNLTLDLHTARP
jgi:hypothetical protein